MKQSKHATIHINQLTKYFQARGRHALNYVDVILVKDHVHLGQRGAILSLPGTLLRLHFMYDD